mgnify:CR=1 FL=1
MIFCFNLKSIKLNYFIIIIYDNEYWDYCCDNFISFNNHIKLQLYYKYMQTIKKVKI